MNAITVSRFGYRRLMGGATLLTVLVLSGCGGGGAGIDMFSGYSYGYNPSYNYGIGGTTSGSVSTYTPTFNSTLPVAGQSTGSAGVNQAQLTVEQYSVVNNLGGSTANTPFVTVNVCNSSTTPAICQSIDHVVLDTGSYGLRLLASALNPALQLPTLTQGSSGAVTECVAFVSGYTWGSVASATVQIGGEVAYNLPVQVVADPSIPAAPASCVGSGAGTDLGNLVGMGGNGLLGIGPLVQDQGNYYLCSSAGSCNPISLPLANQVANPVSSFAQDNNGIIIQFPAVLTAGQPTASGTLTFGLNTQSNNSLAGYSLLPADSSTYFTAVVNGQSYPQSFIDSGSNYNFITLSNFSTDSYGNYAPGSYTTVAAALTSNTTAPAMPTPLQVQFGVLDSILLDFTNNAAFSDVVAPGSAGSADFGMNFFYGKSIGFLLAGKTISQGAGPLYALQCGNPNCL